MELKVNINNIFQLKFVLQSVGPEYYSILPQEEGLEISLDAKFKFPQEGCNES